MQVVDRDDAETLLNALDKTCNELHVSFLHPGTGLHAEREAASPCVRFRCFIVAGALFLRRDTELSSAVALLRSTIIDTARHRLEVGLEDSAGNAVFTLPWRAWSGAKEWNLPLWLGDYCTPDETRQDSYRRLEQLTGLPMSGLEAVPAHLDEYKILQRRLRECVPIANASDIPSSKVRPRLPVLVFATAVVLFLSLVIQILRSL